MFFLNSNDVLKMKMEAKLIASKKKMKDFNIDPAKKKIVVCLAADYGNLGDVAITYAQTKYLKEKFPEYEIIDFPISKTISQMKSLKSLLNKDDIITIVGGGNMGDSYYGIEVCRQFIIKKFPFNRIISFPQTIDYSNTLEGKRRLKQAINIYKKHKNLTLVAREQESFDFFKEHFSENKSVLAPDIVFYLNESNPNLKREGILLCLRNDKEKQLNNLFEKQLFDFFDSRNDVTISDTQIQKNEMSLETREKELEKIWKSFKQSKLVVTDRLHGMIFCYITKTPCVAINNSNKKVSKVYNSWLRNIRYITLVESLEIEEFKNIIVEKVQKDFSSNEVKDEDFTLELNRIVE